MYFLLQKTSKKKKLVMRKTGKVAVVEIAKKSKKEKKRENVETEEEKEPSWCLYTNATSVAKSGEQ